MDNVIYAFGITAYIKVKRETVTEQEVRYVFWLVGLLLWAKGDTADNSRNPEKEVMNDTILKLRNISNLLKLSLYFTRNLETKHSLRSEQSPNYY